MTDPRIEWLDRMWFAQHPWCRLRLRRALIGERYDWDLPKDPLGTEVDPMLRTTGSGFLGGTAAVRFSQ
jgi:hypothetical protein